MKPSELIVTEPIKTMFGKLTSSWKACIAGTCFQHIAPDKFSAVAGLQNRFAQFDRHGGTRRYFHTRSGEMLCLYYTFDGWCYDIVRAGDARPGVCCLACKSEQEAIAAVQLHVNQYNQDALSTPA